MNPLVIYVFTGSCVSLFVWSTVSIYHETVSVDFRKEREERFVGNFLWSLIHPFVQLVAYAIGKVPTRASTRAPLAGWGDTVVALFDALRARCRDLILNAGKGGAMTPDELMATVVVGGALGSAIGSLMYVQVPHWAVYGLFAGTGLILPLVYLGEAARQRQFQIRKALPYSMDLLTLSVEAGLDFTAAVERIVEKQHKNALAQEWSLLLREVRMGKTRSQALKDMARRANLDEVRSLCSAIVQADELGASLAPTLRIQSEQLREKRSVRGETLAQKAPVKVMLALIAFIFPTVVLIIFSPMVIKTFRLP
ncbi:MAG: type II secretion system F family protein [Planctomycetes bacterium]|nr:type II secretion system F family protein [Planctomycetota bacterium]